ncbi:carbohydrate kinase family protein [Saccharothrix syringae]|uniref:carbohydrate kinase family protein n=1 Tax=Saccharothrix syringae TaxID=103733 RepID=UPI0014777C24|nr:carbohydrate kinase family protein [Saccharothrix syringae]
MTAHPDVVGVGALNLDHVVTTDLDVGLEPGVEHAVDAATARAAVEAVAPAGPRTALGGSAFNAVHAIARTGSGLRLGYVGVAGRAPGFDVVREFERLGVDHRFVFEEDDLLCGTCVSLVRGGERTLLTHDGANARLADLVGRHFDELAGYLAGARVVHVTSLLDDRAPGRLPALLTEVRRRSPGTVLSFDPGHAWCAARPPGVDGIARLSDCLLLNEREFRALGDHRPGEPERDTAARLLARFADPRAAVVVKRPTGTAVFRRDGDEFHPGELLAERDIADPTGAGDAFAAGLLAVLARDRSAVGLGASLGMALARHKMRHAGYEGFPGLFQEIYSSSSSSRCTAGGT